MENQKNETERDGMKRNTYEVDGKLLGVKDLGIPLHGKQKSRWTIENWRALAICIAVIIPLIG